MKNSSHSTALPGWVLPILLLTALLVIGSVSFVSASSSSSGGGGSVDYPGGSIANVSTNSAGGVVGTISSCTGGCLGAASVGDTAYYSPTLSAYYGQDYWVTNSSDCSTCSSSGGYGGGSGRRAGGGTNGGNLPPSTPPTGQSPDDGFWTQEETCTSSGKGGQKCNNTWVWTTYEEEGGGEGPCTSTCAGEEGVSLIGGGSGTQSVLEIDAVPRLVRTGGSSTVTWGSIDAESCVVKLLSETVFNGTSGEQVVDTITEQRTYVLQCNMEAGGVLTKSVTISLIPAWREF